MGLFGFGKSKEKAAVASKNDNFALSGPNNASSARCIMAAAVRGVALKLDLGDGKKLEMSHGPVKLNSENAIYTYLDVKGDGAPLRPKKARHLGDQNYWLAIANELLDNNLQVEAILRRMDEILTTNDYLAGPITQADGPVAAGVLQLKKAGSCPQGLSHVDAWLSRVEQVVPEGIRANTMSQVS